MLINILVFSTLLWSSVCYSGGWYYTTVDSIAPPAYLLNYDGDDPSGVTYLDYNGGESTLNATSNTADSVTTSSVQFDAANENLYWGSFEVLPATGTIYCTITVTDRDSDSTMGSFCILEYLYSTTMGIYVYRDASYVRMYYIDGSNTNVASSVSLSFATSYRIGVTWDQPNDKYSISVVTTGNPPSWTEDTGEGLGVWSNTPNTFSIGENASGISVNERVDVSDVYMLSGYQTAE